MERKLRIQYEDAHIIICDKKAGLPVQSAGVGVQDMESMLKTYLMRKTGKKDSYIAVVHRLDQPVEGLVLFAKTKQAAAHFSQQITSHAAGKYYVAVIDGNMEEEQGVLIDYLKKDSKRNCSVVVDKSDREGKESRLEYRVLKTDVGCQLLEIHLLTGRHHQIRVQLSHDGHPIVGDTKYHPQYQNSSRRVFPALCAYKLVFEHPVTGEKMEFMKKPDGEAFQQFGYWE